MSSQKELLEIAILEEQLKTQKAKAEQEKYIAEKLKVEYEHSKYLLDEKKRLVMNAETEAIKRRYAEMRGNEQTYSDFTF